MREPKESGKSHTTNMDEDQALIRKTLNGDDSAFDSLVTRYRDRIYSVALHMLWCEAEAEDVAQEVFVRAYGSLGKFRGDSEFFTWLYRIAVNLVYTQARRLARRREIHAQAFIEMQRVLPAPKLPSEAAENAELAESLHAALLRLDPRLRQVVVLRELEGMDVAEVSQILQVPQGTVKSRYFRGREDLRRILAETCQEREARP